MDAGELLPVAVQIPGEGVEEKHPRDRGTTSLVARGLEIHVFGEQRVTGTVPGKHVPTPAEHDRGSGLGQRVEQHEHTRVGLFHGRFGEAEPVGLAGEVVQVDCLHLVQFQHSCQGVENLRRGSAALALLQPRVVAGADAREVSQFLSAQPRNAPAAAVRA